MPESLPIAIIIPVYRGLNETLKCIGSVLSASVQIHFRVIIINDASPESHLVSALDAFKDDPRVTLLHNEQNLGFVATVNIGIRAAGDADVVLLNSDTEVSAGWLDRLHDCVYSAPDIGTATPFSNSATICTYPYPEWTGGLPTGMSLEQIDALFAEANAGQAVDIPTGIGFCLYIRQSCLSATGLFDEQSFGRGYGEENDFCARALAVGWRNVACGDVYVYHAGSVSFGGERAARVIEAEQRLLALHPDYQERLDAFLRADPLQPLRSNVDRARVRRGDTGVVDERIQLERLLRDEKDRLMQMLTEARGFVQDREADVATLRLEYQALEERLGNLLRDREADVVALRQDYQALEERLGDQLREMHAALDICSQQLKARETLRGVLWQEMKSLKNTVAVRFTRKFSRFFKSK